MARRQRGRGRRTPRPLLHRRHLVQEREWDRGTELLTLFSLTAWGIIQVGREVPDARPKPASIVLVGPPGKMKTELLMRFYGGGQRTNPTIALRSDVTARGLWSILLRADRGRITHVLLTEFNRIFQRKAATASSTIGTMTEMMDEGVFETEVGPQKYSFNGARCGIIGAMTGKTLKRRREMLYESGFLDRCAMLPWNPPDEQIKDVMDRIARGDKSDLTKVILPRFAKPVRVVMPVKIGLGLSEYTYRRWPDEALRLFHRFRALTMAAALLDGRDAVKPVDVERAVMQFEDYWGKMVISDAAEDNAPV